MQKLYKHLTVALLLMATPSWAQSVIRDGKEWLQPADLLDVNWYNVADVCPPPDGLCDGSLAGTEVTGYRWASVNDLNALYNSYDNSLMMGPGPSQRTNVSDTIADAFFAEFAPTLAYMATLPPPSPPDVPQSVFETSGWLIDELGPNSGYNSAIGNESGNDVVDIFNDSAIGKTYNPGFIGAWLYRAVLPKQVPASTLPISIFTVLGLIAIASRRLARKNLGTARR
ncbi:MAG: hypothetical protein ACI9JM_003284 [Halioglobus sp.]|jgi:hypothetical protein